MAQERDQIRRSIPLLIHPPGGKSTQQPLQMLLQRSCLGEGASQASQNRDTDQTLLGLPDIFPHCSQRQALLDQVIEISFLDLEGACVTIFAVKYSMTMD